MYLFRNILRIAALLSFLCLTVFFVLEGCGGMSGGDDEDEGLRDRKSTNRDWRNRSGGDRGENEDLENGGNSPWSEPSSDKKSNEEQEAVTVLQPSDNQNPLSDKIDFLFILDTSRSNQNYIKESTIQKKMGNFILKLNQAKIDWRILTTCGSTDKNDSLRGHLHRLENKGTPIPLPYLENHNLKSYYHDETRSFTTYVSDVFIDTISHPDRRKNCDNPPRCHQKKNRPLQALSGFLKLVVSQPELGLLRDGADLIIIIISNQDEQPSKTYNPKDMPGNIHDQLKEDFSDKTWHAITFVVKSKDDGCTNGKASSFIPTIAPLTGGLVVNICLNTYAQTIIDFIQQKQGKRTARIPVTTEEESPTGSHDIDIYGDFLEH